MTDIYGDQIDTTLIYEAYGEVLEGEIPTDRLFTGQRLDQTGLYFYNAGYYDALIGRFISPDTIIPNPANPQSFNRYSYCLNNPLKWVDPSGHSEQDYWDLCDQGEKLANGEKIDIEKVTTILVIGQSSNIPGSQALVIVARNSGATIVNIVYSTSSDENPLIYQYNYQDGENYATSSAVYYWDIISDSWRMIDCSYPVPSFGETLGRVSLFFSSFAVDVAVFSVVVWATGGIAGPTLVGRGIVALTCGYLAVAGTALIPGNWMRQHALTTLQIPMNIPSSVIPKPNY